MSNINERFREIRDDLEQTQEDFAKKAKRTRSEIKNIEYGKTTPKPEVIDAVCEAWGIRKEWLLTGELPKLKSLTRNAQLTKFVGDAMRDADKIDAQRILFALLDATPDEIKAIASFARRLADQYEGEEKGSR